MRKLKGKGASLAQAPSKVLGGVLEMDPWSFVL